MLKTTFAFCLFAGFLTPATAQVSYQFHKSVPFEISEVEAYVAELTGIKPGDGCTVRMVSSREFGERFGTDGHTATVRTNPCRIYFDRWFYSSVDLARFRTVLVHELLHAIGCEHNRNKESIMHKDYRYGQVLLEQELECLKTYHGEG